MSFITVNLILPGNDEVSHVFTADSSLHDVIEHFQKEEEAREEAAKAINQPYKIYQFRQYTGVPDNEAVGPSEGGRPLIEIQYNLPGIMQPTFEILNTATPTQIYSANTHNLREIFLKSLPHNNHSQSPDITFKFSHKYTTDHLSKEQQQQAVNNVLRRFKSYAQDDTSSNVGSSNTRPSGQEQRTSQILRALEQKLPLIPPKITVSYTISPPFQPTPLGKGKNDDEQDTNQDHIDEKLSNHSSEEESSEIGSEEITDSDDDRFYKPNKQDYRIIYDIYQRIKAESESESPTPKSTTQSPTQKPNTKFTTPEGKAKPAIGTYRVRLPKFSYTISSEGNAHQVTLQFDVELQCRSTDSASELYILLEQQLTRGFLQHLNTKSPGGNNIIITLPPKHTIGRDGHPTFREEKLKDRTSFNANFPNFHGNLNELQLDESNLDPLDASFIEKIAEAVFKRVNKISSNY